MRTITRTVIDGDIYESELLTFGNSLQSDVAYNVR